MPSIVHVHFGRSGRQFLIAEATTAQLSHVKPVPPQAFFVGSAIFHYLGPSFAVLLFARVDVLGVAWLRIASAALVFALWRRPWRKFRALDRQGQLLILALGAVFAVMNACFYISIDRLPLATVAAIEFIGPIALAVIGARTSRNFAAVLAAVLGVYLLTHVRFGGQPVGVGFAFANAALFTAYIVLAHRVARRSAMGGVDGLAAAMMFAFVFVSPIGFAGAAHALGDPVAIGAGIGVGLMGGILLTFMLVYLLHWAAPDLPLWACYAIMGSLLAIAGALLCYRGIADLKSFNPIPKQTVQALKENLQWKTAPY